MKNIHSYIYMCGLENSHNDFCTCRMESKCGYFYVSRIGLEHNYFVKPRSMTCVVGQGHHCGNCQIIENGLTLMQLISLVCHYHPQSCYI
jgi:hypothetical protein